MSGSKVFAGPQLGQLQLQRGVTPAGEQLNGRELSEVPVDGAFEDFALALVASAVEAVAVMGRDGLSGEAVPQVLGGRLESASMARVGRGVGAEQIEQVAAKRSGVRAARVVGAERVHGLAQVGDHVGDVSRYCDGILDPLQGRLALCCIEDLLGVEIQLVELADRVSCLEVADCLIEGAQSGRPLVTVLEDLGTPDVDALGERPARLGDPVGVIGALRGNALHERLVRATGADLAGGYVHQLHRVP